MYEIIPGILEKDWDEIERKIELIKPFAKSIHVDLLDGKFAPNQTFFDPTPFAKYSKDFLFELHMMVDNPVQYVDQWADAGVRRFIGQLEMMPSQEDFVKSVKGRGCEVGIALDSPTDIDSINIEYESLDLVFIMTVKAGFSNQSFIPEMLKKVSDISGLTNKPIEVDGGINDQTIKHAIDSGATRFVSTGFLFKSNDIKSQYDKLLTCCSASLRA